MDLWQLKIFSRVVEYESFSKAAQAVRLSQPTVSSHIKDLEEHFGTQLVNRTARKASPTKAGDLLYAYAQRLLSLKDETESAIADFLGSVAGKLTIGASTIPGAYLLPKLIGEFVKKFPDVRVSMKVADSSEIISYLLDRRIEAGFVGVRSGSNQLEEIPLAQDRLMLIIPSAHKWADRDSIQISELMKEPFIAREQGSGTLRSLIFRLQAKGLSLSNLNIIAEMGNTEAVRQAIKANLGISVLSTIAVADDLASGQLKALSILDLDLTQHFYFVKSKHQSFSPLCRAFIDFTQQNIGQVMPLSGTIQETAANSTL
ncbi:MAG: LysR family transcriptional regulator [Desulfobacteraceae bacterium]|nr:LysR family transcriptional regulator [Desulfobacteraceae bacterium]